MSRMVRLLRGLALLGVMLFGITLPRGQAECVPKRVAVRDIPRAARETLDYVRAHGQAPPGQVGGRRFGNYGGGGEQKLPVNDAQGHHVSYQEWDIYPKVPGRNRGPERLVTGSDGRAWYTADHYCSFTELP